MPTLFDVFNDVQNNSTPREIDFTVQQNHEKFGLVYSPSQRVVIPYEYDNIFRYGFNVFALCKRGKWGAVCFFDDTIKWIAACEYDTLDTNYHDFIFSKIGKQRYYFEQTGIIRDFNQIDIIDPYSQYIFAVDDDSYYILKSATGTVLWTCSKNDEGLCPLGRFCGDPCLVSLGEKNGLPIFFDCTNANYIVPDDENKLVFARHNPNMIMPIIVNGKNVVTITDESGVNVGDFDECFNKDIGENAGFDEVTVEIKVTLKGKNRTDERCYPILNDTVVTGEVRE